MRLALGFWLSVPPGSWEPSCRRQAAESEELYPLDGLGRLLGEIVAPGQAWAVFSRRWRSRGPVSAAGGAEGPKPGSSLDLAAREAFLTAAG